MLGRGRNLCVGDGLDGGAVTQRPDLAFVVLQFEAGIDEQLAALVGAIELLNYRRSADGTVEMSVLQGISSPDCKIALSDVAAGAGDNPLLEPRARHRVHPWLATRARPVAQSLNAFLGERT